MFSSFIHLFIPHHSNNHRPHILHPQGSALLVAIFLFAHATINLFAQVRGDVLGYASSITPESVLDGINIKRTQTGLNPLKLSPQLNQAATMKASDMFTLNYWAHTNPNGREPWDFIKTSGYRYRYAGENLARDFGDTPSMVDAWMASATHRDNVINPHYQDIGIAVVNGTLQGIETTLVVNMFGSPQASLPKISGLQTQVQAQKSPQTLQPTPLAANLTNTTLAASPNPTPLISPFLLEKVLASSIVILVILTLAWDTIHSRRYRLVRLVGRNPAHLLFLLLVLATIIISQPGGLL